MIDELGDVESVDLAAEHARPDVVIVAIEGTRIADAVMERACSGWRRRGRSSPCATATGDASGRAV